MLLRVLFIMLSLLGSTLSYAADEDVEVVPAKKTVEADSSENNRMNKTYIFDAQLLGSGPNVISSQGLSAGYFLNRNMIVSIEATTGTRDNDSFLFSTSSDSYNIRGNSVGVHFKHFVGNSFYYRTGIDYRSLKYKYDYTSSFSPANNVHRSFDGKSFGVTFAIGNQWQFENFNIGCDWIGFTVPLSKSISNESVTSPSATYDNEQLADDEKTYIKNTSATLLRFYLGATF
jgi:hypothetical protein